jgi:1,4-dihydroxy-2-naphthoate octaprenyltransferase
VKYLINFKHIYNNIITIFVEVGFIVPIVAVGKIIITMYALSISITYEPIFLAFIGSLPIYLFDRLDLDDEDLNSTKKQNRVRMIQKYKNIFTFIALFSIILFITILFIKLPFYKFLLTNIPLCIFMMYSKLKETLFLDTVGIAIAWSSELIFISVFFSNINIAYSTIVPLFFGLAIMKSSESELSNIRDKDADYNDGKYTIPIKFGVKNTIRGIICMELLALLIISILINNILFTLLSILSGVLIVYTMMDVKKDSISSIMFKNRLIKITLGISLLIL